MAGTVIKAKNALFRARRRAASSGQMTAARRCMRGPGMGAEGDRVTVLTLADG